MTNEYKLRGSSVSSTGDSRKKRSSVNARYDRMFGNVLSAQYQPRKASISASSRSSLDLQEAISLKAQEKYQQAKKDDEVMYKKMGFRAGKGTSGRGRNLNVGGGVMENLEKYRMGNVPPPRGNTPPATLADDLQRIIYPPKPPPRAPTPPYQPPAPVQEQHSSIRRLSHSHDQAQQSSPIAYITYETHAHQAGYQYPSTPAHPPAQNLAPRTPTSAYQPPPGPSPPGIPQLNGWIFVANTGWMYLPPPSPYTGSGQMPYPQLPPPPPPPPFLQTSSPYYSSPYNVGPGQENGTPYFRRQGDPESEDRPRQTMQPKSILRNSSSSESSNTHPSSRTVTFRNTPDFASPTLPVEEMDMADHTYPGEKEVEEEAYSSPPKWTLRKIIPGRQPIAEPEPTSSEMVGEESMYQGRGTVLQYGNRSVHYQNPSQSNARVSTVPAILASAHQQLLHGHGIVPEASGKRSGRALVQNLEELAEAHTESAPRVGRGGPLANEDVGYDPREEPGQRQKNFASMETPRHDQQAIIEREDEQKSHDRNQTPSRDRPPQSYTGNDPSKPMRPQKTKRDLPAPSQNWRESQRPQMAFSEAGSFTSQTQSQSQVSLSQQSAWHAFRDNSSPRRVDQQRLAPGHQTINNDDARHSGPQDYLPQDEDRENQEDQETYDEDQVQHQDSRHGQDHVRPRYSDSRHQALQSRDYDPSQDQPPYEDQDELDEEDETRQPVPASPPLSVKTQTKIPKRRLTDLEVRYDDDPADSSYRPPQSPDADELDLDLDLVDELEEEDDHQPGPKRVKVTEGAWAKYDIPQDKLPQPKYKPQARYPARARPRQGQCERPPVKEEGYSQSQVSQIEQSSDNGQGYGDENENENENGNDTEGEDIEAWSYGHSQQSGEVIRNVKLPTIPEGPEEGDEDQGEGSGIQADAGDKIGEMRGKRSWVEDGFFSEGGELGFQIWRDGY